MSWTSSSTVYVISISFGRSGTYSRRQQPTLHSSCTVRCLDRADPLVWSEAMKNSMIQLSNQVSILP
jgi:hypothetical protein